MLKDGGVGWEKRELCSLLAGRDLGSFHCVAQVCVTTLDHFAGLWYLVGIRGKKDHEEVCGKFLKQAFKCFTTDEN